MFGALSLGAAAHGYMHRSAMTTHTEHLLIRLVGSALHPHAKVDFPAVTAICEGAASHPAEVPEALTMLVAMLEEQELRPTDARNTTQDLLKALTILNELVTNNAVVTQLRSTLGAREALLRLQGFQGGGLGSQTDENIRMFANEVCRTVFSGSQPS
mmetsp:Transcript_59315/g.129919  ORF Transcript_59315/g.129919 Transcript_59315/m.129919 type:complete len:157 (-) Transcript_59315:57-527(-)